MLLLIDALTFAFFSLPVIVLAVTFCNRDCASKSHYQTPKLQCMNYLSVILTEAYRSNIPPAKNMKLTTPSAMVLAQLSHDHMAHLVTWTRHSMHSCAIKLYSSKGTLTKRLPWTGNRSSGGHFVSIISCKIRNFSPYVTEKCIYTLVHQSRHIICMCWACDMQTLPLLKVPSI